MELQLRRCIGSKTFGIEPHDAPITDFPIQPSQKDGLGRLCRPHWTQYTGALRKAALARQAAQAVATEPAPASARPARTPRAGKKQITPEVMDRLTGPKPAKAAAPKRPSGRARSVNRPLPVEAIAAAQALVEATEILAGTEYTTAIASEEVQAAFEVLAAASPHETPAGATIDTGTEEADLAIAG